MRGWPWGLALAASVVVSGCDLGSVSEAPVSAECTAIGARCQRPDGPIGVCQQTNCTSGAKPPCYVCTPQH